jgi:hypothetical protein
VCSKGQYSTCHPESFDFDRKDITPHVILSPSVSLGTGSAKDPYDVATGIIESQGFLAPDSARNGVQYEKGVEATNWSIPAWLATSS